MCATSMKPDDASLPQGDRGEMVLGDSNEALSAGIITIRPDPFAALALATAAFALSTCTVVVAVGSIPHCSTMTGWLRIYDSICGKN